jgi:hypothetical protein
MAPPRISKIHQRVQDRAADKVLSELGADGVPKGMPSNNFWDEAQNMQNISRDGLNKIGTVVADLAHGLSERPEAMQHVPDPKQVVQQLTLLSSDMDQHGQLLDALAKQHEGRQGSTTTPEDHANYMRVMQGYMTAYDLFETLVSNRAHDVSATIGRAIDQCNAVGQSDPNVISDAILVTKEQQHG